MNMYISSYIYIHTHTYIIIIMCVCVCVCVCKYMYILYIYIKIAFNAGLTTHTNFTTHTSFTTHTLPQMSHPPIKKTHRFWKYANFTTHTNFTTHPASNVSSSQSCIRNTEFLEICRPKRATSSILLPPSNNTCRGLVSSCELTKPLYCYLNLSLLL
jgi:hypothetical protein